MLSEQDFRATLLYTSCIQKLRAFTPFENMSSGSEEPSPGQAALRLLPLTALSYLAAERPPEDQHLDCKPRPAQLLHQNALTAAHAASQIFISFRTRMSSYTPDTDMGALKAGQR